MEMVERLLQAIDDWGKEANPDVVPLQDMVPILLYRFGTIVHPNEATIEQLRTRLVYLVDQEKIQERVVVEAVISAITAVLTRNLEKHGEQILSNEFMADQLREKGFDAEKLEKSFERFINPARAFVVQREIERWELALLTHLPKSERDSIESRSLAENARR